MEQKPDLASATTHIDGRTRVRHGNLAYDLPAYLTLAAWEARAAHLRRRILTAAGLWPAPERCALRPRVMGRIEHEGYTIENVFFESWPGFYVCGNLYRPKDRQGPFPGVLCPHGHWAHGRLHDEARGSIPARCITLARQGYVALAYDMIGYNDSGVQIAGKVAELGDGGPDDGPHKGPFHAPRHFLWGMSLLALQLWNSVRALDYLASLPDVDEARLACTGASGGGTQTFLLCAIDERVRVAAPVNMISAHFQGGCACENAPHLRLDCTNVEIAALMAPRPLLMVSATGDWTVNTPQVEYPAVRAIYRLFGAEERVATVQVDAPHNYNHESREAVYAWFGRWLLGIDDAEALQERPYQVDPPERMRVFGVGQGATGRPETTVALPAEAVTPAQLTEYWIEQAKAQIQALAPREGLAREGFARDAATLQAYRETMGVAYRYALNARLPQAGELRVERVGVEERAGVEGLPPHRAERLILGRCEAGERTPALLLVPEDPVGAVLVVHPEGVQGAVMAGQERGMETAATMPEVATTAGQERGMETAATLVEGTVSIAPDGLIALLLARRLAVLTLDAWGTGELAALERDETVDHFLCFNRSDAALRVQDVLNGMGVLSAGALWNAAVPAAAGRLLPVHLLGLGQAGLWCLLARALCGGEIARTVVDAAQFPCDDDRAWLDALYLPQVRRAGDLRTAAALIAPGVLYVHNAAPAFPSAFAGQAYLAAGAHAALHIQSQPADVQTIVSWLTEPFHVSG